MLHKLLTDNNTAQMNTVYSIKDFIRFIGFFLFIHGGYFNISSIDKNKKNADECVVCLRHTFN